MCLLGCIIYLEFKILMTKENNRAEMGEGWLCTRSGRPKQSVWPAQRAGKGPHAEGGEGGRRLEEAGQERGQGPSPGGRLSRSDHLGDVVASSPQQDMAPFAPPLQPTCLCTSGVFYEFPFSDDVFTLG